MSDAFQIILHSFTILLLVIYLNLNFTNNLYILKQKKSTTNKNNRRNLKWSSLHGRVSHSLHRNKKVNFFLNGCSIKILISLQLAFKILTNNWIGQQGTPQSMSAIDNWGNMHRHGETRVNPQAEQTFVNLLSIFFFFFIR